MMLMSQHKFISYRKYPLLVGDVDNEGGYALWSQGEYRKFLYLPFNFAVNLNFSKSKFSIKNKLDWFAYCPPLTNFNLIFPYLSIQFHE